MKPYYGIVKISIYRSRVQRIRVYQGRKLLPVVLTSNRLISHSGSYSIQRKLYHQKIKDIDHLNRVLLHCWV